MPKALKNYSFMSCLFFALAFIVYLSFCITLTVNYGSQPETWFILVFIFIFGLGYFLGIFTAKIGNLARNCLVVLLIGNIAVSLTMDPEQLAEISSQNPGWLNSAHVFNGLGGLCAIGALIVLTLGYSIPVLGVLFKKIGRLMLLLTAVLYLGAVISYFFAGTSYWFFLGILTAVFVYTGFYFGIPAVDKNPLNV